MTLTKIDDRGLKTPIDLLDNEKIRFGTGNDLELYHDGNTWINHNGAGGLVIRATTNDLYLQSDNNIFIGDVGGNEYAIKCVDDAQVELYHNGTKTFETTTTGILVSNPASSGDAVVNVKGGEGGSAILQLQSDEGDDNADFYRLLVPDTSQFNIQTYTSGSWANILTLDNSSNATFAGTVKVGSNSAPSLLESSTGGGGTEDIFRVGLNRTNASTSDKQIWSEYTVSSSLSNFAIYARSANDTGTAGLQFKVDAVAGTVSDKIGNVRRLGTNAQSSTYTLAASDSGKVIYDGGDIQIPAGTFVAGDMVTIINNSGSDVAINKVSGASVDIYLAGNATPGNRTLATRGVATIVWQSPGQCYVSGAGLS